MRNGNRAVANSVSSDLRQRGSAMMGGTSPGIAAWIWFLGAITVLNVAIWLRTAVALQRERALQGPERRDYRRRQLILSALFVAGCAFRSIFPRADVQRICLYDNWLSVVLIGRAVATVAELAFMTQWAFLLGESAGPGQRDVAKIVSRVLVPSSRWPRSAPGTRSCRRTTSATRSSSRSGRSSSALVLVGPSFARARGAAAFRGDRDRAHRRVHRLHVDGRRSDVPPRAGGPTSRASGRISPSSKGCATPGSIAW